MLSNQKLSEHPIWSRAKLGKDVLIGTSSRLFGDPRFLTIGDGCKINDFAIIIVSAQTYIGNGCKIGFGATIEAFDKVSIYDNSSLMAGCRVITRYELVGGGLSFGPVTIGSGSVIGPNAVLLPGCELAAMSDISPLEVCQ